MTIAEEKANTKNYKGETNRIQIMVNMDVWRDLNESV